MAHWPSFAALGDVPESLGYYVYEFWGADGCLYVGRVGNNGPGSVRKRFTGHVGKPWWPDVTRVVVTAFASHEEIVIEEPRRIQELRPRYNRQYKWLVDTEAPPPAGTTDREDAYQASYRQRQDRKQKEYVRTRTRDQTAWQDEYNSRPEVKLRKKKWLRTAGRRPGSGQAALW